MSTQPKNMTDWSLGTHEIGKYSPREGESNASFLKLHIPKIIPLVPFDTPKQTIVSISKSFMLNSDQCKPSISATTKTQNYLTVPRHANSNFSHSLLASGSQLYVEVLNNNVDTLRVTNKIDPSYDPHIN